MSTTLIRTHTLARSALEGAGEFADILNHALCGAENVTGTLRWLGAGERFVADTLDATHQLVYLMDGEGSIGLDGRDYDVGRGAGIYLGPAETATISHRGSGTLKLFHLIVPIRDELQLDR